MKLVLVMLAWVAGASAACSAPCGQFRSVEFQGSPFDDLAKLSPAMGIEDLARAFGRDATALIAAHEAKEALEKVANVVDAPDADAPCVFRLRLTTDGRLPVQAFQYHVGAHDVEIAGDSIGLLYGVYDLLDRLGFKWYAPEGPWKFAPDALNWPVAVPREVVKPSASLRGVRTDEDATVPDSYLIWMARNRFNLIGLSGTNARLAAALGIKLEAGGHDLISEILSGDRVVDGLRLADVHPEWYGQGSAPIKPGSDFYDNPCFAADGLAEFFADDLADRILGGDLSDASIVDVWPADQTSVSLAKSCPRPWPEARDVDQLFQFYVKTIEVVDQRLRSKKPGRKIRISGLSYYDMWEPPDSRIMPELAPRSNVDYVHVLYVNERTYSQPLDPSSTGTNKRIYDAMVDWASRLSAGGVRVGICDYYNYSIYNSLPATFSSTLPADYVGYRKIGADLLTYMHPIGGDPGPHRLMEALRSRLPWGASADQVIDDYFKTAFDAQAAVAHQAYDELDRGVSNLAEMWGAVGGLTQLIAQKVYWASPPLSDDEVRSSLSAYLAGGQETLPDVRPTHFSPLESSFVGLSESRELLNEAVADLQRAAEGPSRDRLLIDAGWAEFARLQYKVLAAAVEATQQGESGDQFRANIAGELAQLSQVDKFNLTLSPINQRRLFQTTVDALERSLEPRSWRDDIWDWLRWVKRTLL